MNSILGLIQLGAWEVGAALERPYDPYPAPGTSVPGLIELGLFEPGAIPPPGVSTATCSGAGQPKRTLSYSGGVPEPFTSVPGSIQPGVFELGAVPTLSLEHPSGSHFCEGFADPTRGARIPPRTATCSGSGYPVRAALGNLGPLLCSGKGNPARSASSVAYYATMTCSGAAQPVRVIVALVPGSAAGAGHPIRTLFPIGTQQVSCVTGANPPEGPPAVNYVY